MLCGIVGGVFPYLEHRRCRPRWQVSPRWKDMPSFWELVQQMCISCRSKEVDCQRERRLREREVMSSSE